MRRLLILLYGVACYGLFLLTFLYLIGFVGGFAVPRTVDGPTSLSLMPALVINALLIGLFAVQHSVMARPWFKQWWTSVIPTPIERSTYVLFSNLVLILMYLAWQGLPQTVWSVEQPLVAGLLWVIFALGWGIALLSTFLIDHFDLFGLRQVTLHYLNKPYTNPVFRQILLYRWVRHPLMLGFLLAFWATPHMTLGHLEFAILMTGYILIGIYFEERDLLAHHGDAYRSYQQEVPRLCPFTHRARQHPATNHR